MRHTRIIVTHYGGPDALQVLEEERPVPSGLDPAEAVSLVLNYITAYQMLHRSARVKAGQRVLTHGEAGGVGSPLMQPGPRPLGFPAGLKESGLSPFFRKKGKGGGWLSVKVFKIKQEDRRLNLWFKLALAVLLVGPSLLLQGCELPGGSQVPRSPTAEQALLPSPDYANKKAAGWNRDGIDHLKREHWRKAAADFGRALEQDPDFPEAHFNRALALQAQGKAGEAKEHFRLALKKAGGDKRIGDSPALPDELKPHK